MARGGRLLRVFSVLMGALLACSLPGRIPGLGPDASQAPTPAADLEPARHEGLIDALTAKVEAGEWTFEEGLVQTLQLFTGEAALGEVYAEEPASMEGTGIVLEAERTLAAGGDSPARAELERLLEVLLPPTERLLEVASPAAEGSGRGPGPASPGAAVDCESLYSEGFPAGSGLQCLAVHEAGIGGHTVRIFIPLSAMPLDYGDAALTGVLQSWQRFSTLTISGQASVMQDVEVVFVLLPEIESPTVLAKVITKGGQSICRIVVYLGAIAYNEVNASDPDDFGRFLQMIAHEMFHCYQQWNLPNHFPAPPSIPSGSAPSWGVQDWWGEGTAEYFANVVYPDVNDEWGNVPELAQHSAEKSVVFMSYDNFAFFQFMANQMTDDLLLGLLRDLPFLGDEAQQAAALAGWPDIQTLFHQFGRAYMDGQIMDTSGAPIPTIPPFIPPGHQIEVNEAQIRTLEASPFVLSRYAITFGHGRRYSVVPTLTGSAEGYEAGRVDFAGSPWGDLPESVSTACAPVRYYVLLTSAVPTAAGDFSLELAMTPEEDLACDECLIGTWDINIESFAEYAAAPFLETPDLYQFDAAGGLWRYRFRQDGMMTAEFDFFYTYILNQANSPFGNDITVNGNLTIAGTATGTYASDGLSNLSVQPVENAVALSQGIYMNGELIGEGPIQPSGYGGFDFGAGADAVYSCDAEEGILLLNFAPNTDLPPIRFDRASSAP
jgi:hypothetical protein